MRLFTITAAVLCALAWAGAAQAGTFSVRRRRRLLQRRPSGETNRVFLISEERPVRGFRVIDPGAALTAGAGCTSVGRPRSLLRYPQLPGSRPGQRRRHERLREHVGRSSRRDPARRRRRERRALHRPGLRRGAWTAGRARILFEGEGARPWTTRRGLIPSPSRPGDGLANDGEAGENDLIGHVDTVIGGAGADSFTLTGFDGTVLAGGGNDHISAVGLSFCGLGGGPGNDVIEADDGFSSLGGGGGNDTLDRGQRLSTPRAEAPARIVLRGGPGPRLLSRGDRGADELIGGTGHDHAARGVRRRHAPLEGRLQRPRLREPGHRSRASRRGRSTSSYEASSISSDADRISVVRSRRLALGVAGVAQAGHVLLHRRRRDVRRAGERERTTSFSPSRRSRFAAYGSSTSVRP